MASRYTWQLRHIGGYIMVGRAGPLATRNRELGQARKGAAAAVDAGAGVWLVRTATNFLT